MGENEVHISQRVAALKLRAAQRYDIPPERCHVGHVVLQAMLDMPDYLNQIDGATGESETNGSVASRSCQLASAMWNFGLRPGDTVVIIGPNHVDLCIPYYACHFNGYTMCAIDPSITKGDLIVLFSFITPRIIFCPKEHVELTQESLTKNGLESKIVTFNDKKNHMNNFIKSYKGTRTNFRPQEFDTNSTIAWLMMTSGTTGVPKLGMIPYITLLNGIRSWWSIVPKRIYVNLAMGTIQWMSSLFFFISGPLMKYTRLQSSAPITPKLLVMLINKYKPNATAWTPHMLGKFLETAGDVCDLSSFIYISIGGSSIEKPLLNQFRTKCDAKLYLVYGMTELLVPVFEYNDHVPFGSAGKPLSKFQYRIVVEDDKIRDKNNNETGELWIKGDEFFTGYYNNAEETDKVMTKDGWIKTGDMFYKDENDYYYFVERKRLLIKYTGHFISPIQLEEVIKQHPGVSEACVVAVPDPGVTELPIGAVAKKPGHHVTAQDIFDLLKKSLPELKQLHGGLFFMDVLPTTPSGKVHRAKIKEIAFRTPRIMPTHQCKTV